MQADGTVADKDNLYTMPAFKTSSQLDDQAIDLLARWLRGEWYEPKAAE